MKSEIDDLLKEAPFRFAKTMPTMPHWYILEKEYGGRFVEIVDFINQNGVAETFYSRTYTYYYANGYKYWAMKITDGTGIINRAYVKPI